MANASPIAEHPHARALARGARIGAAAAREVPDGQRGNEPPVMRADDDDTAERFGRSVLGLLNSQLGGLEIRAKGFLRQGMLAQHAETLLMMADLRKQMRENAEKYGVETPSEALEPETGPDAVVSHNTAAATLAQRNFATVDSFLGHAAAEALRSEVLQMHADGQLRPGLIEGGRATNIRGDYVAYVDERAAQMYPVRDYSRCSGTDYTDNASLLRNFSLYIQGFGACLEAQDKFVGLLSRTVPELKCIGLSRQRAMVANYPSAGARYARHVDNPDQNGRKLTVILYLNPGAARRAKNILMLPLVRISCREG